MPKKGERVVPPPRRDEWDFRYGDSAAVDGWNDLCAQAPGPARDAYDAIVKEPRDSSRPSRQHRMKGSLASRTVAGEKLEQWQFEVTGGGRIWYCIDDARRKVILVFASTKHPKVTE